MKAQVSIVRDGFGDFNARASERREKIVRAQISTPLSEFTTIPVASQPRATRWMSHSCLARDAGWRIPRKREKS